MNDDLNSIGRRQFLQLSTAVTIATPTVAGGVLAGDKTTDKTLPKPDPSTCPILRPVLTPDPQFVDVSRGDPKPHTLSEEKVIQAKLTPETWSCEITADPFIEEPHTKVPATIERPLTETDGNAL
ncbi:MAG: hypothetical protein ABL921_23820, partial [Pirellula sp.]